jgi:hypothetical protein
MRLPHLGAGEEEIPAFARMTARKGNDGAKKGNDGAKKRK